MKSRRATAERTTAPRGDLTRRSVVRGAAWAAPVVVVSAAAPVFAASAPTSCLEVAWNQAVYSGANGKWGFHLTFTNGCYSDITVTSYDVRTFYDLSATNNGPQVATTVNVNQKVLAQSTLTVPTNPTDSSRAVFTNPPTGVAGPKGASSANYYNDFPGGNPPDDGNIACASTPVAWGSPDYPDSCQQLASDQTAIDVHYTVAGGGSGTVTVTMAQAQPTCRVVAGCQ